MADRIFVTSCMHEKVPLPRADCNKLATTSLDRRGHAWRRSPPGAIFSDSTHFRRIGWSSRAGVAATVIVALAVVAAMIGMAGRECSVSAGCQLAAVGR